MEYCDKIWQSFAEDWLNVSRTRNYENTDKEDYNCGGYCLNTFSWYSPYDEYLDDEGYSSLMDYAQDLYFNYDFQLGEVYDTLLKMAKEKILQDFPDKVRLIHNSSQVLEEEKLVVYKIGIDVEEEDEPYIVHIDFHFKQWEGSYWSHKPGSTSIELQYSPLREVIKEPWSKEWIENSNGYDSYPILFAVKKN